MSAGAAGLRVPIAQGFSATGLASYEWLQILAPYDNRVLQLSLGIDYTWGL